MAFERMQSMRTHSLGRYEKDFLRRRRAFEVSRAGSKADSLHVVFVIEQRGIQSFARPVRRRSISLAVARTYIPNRAWRDIPLATGSRGEHLQIRVITGRKEIGSDMHLGRRRPMGVCRA
jgi:hypothetical protein